MKTVDIWVCSRLKQGYVRDDNKYVADYKYDKQLMVIVSICITCQGKEQAWAAVVGLARVYWNSFTTFHIHTFQPARCLSCNMLP